MKKSRTENVVTNIWFALITQIANIILSFISRTAFIRILGIDYLGVNGLFTNILMLLSFAELGIGSAIVYSMYKPLATEDIEKTKSLMALYAKAYRFIGLFIFLLGILVIPFMGIIIKDPPNITENINFIYFLFLINTTISYFFVYKKSIIIADQKNYIVALYGQIFNFIQIVAQIVLLLLTHEYILFLLIQIISTALNNIFMARKANKMYPYLKEGFANPLDRLERSEIFTNVRALFMYKFGSVILNGTSNIMISALIGITAVGLSSNYLLLISAVSTISRQVMDAFTASVGNLNAIGEVTDKERVFKRIFFVSAWMYGFFAVALFIFLNPFITLWLGDTYLLSQSVVFAIVLHFYINSIHFAAYTYRITMGLFVQGRFAPLAAAILNIVLSFWMGKTIGLMGIFLATSIARFLTTGLVDPFLVYRKGFNKNPLYYYQRYLMFTAIFVGLYFLLSYAIKWITIEGIPGFALKITLVTIVFNIVMLLLFYHTQDFQEIKKILVAFLFNRIGKKTSPL